MVLISVMFSPPLTTACLPTEQQGFDHPLEYSEGNEGRENGTLEGLAGRSYAAFRMWTSENSSSRNCPKSLVGL